MKEANPKIPSTQDKLHKNLEFSIGLHPSHLLALESRIMLDAAAAVVVADAVESDSVESETQGSDSASANSTPSEMTESAPPNLTQDQITTDSSESIGAKEVVFVDANAQATQQISEQADVNTDVVIIDDATDGVETVKNTLADSEVSYAKVHIVTDINDTGIKLGNSYLSIESMENERAGDLGIIRGLLNNDTHIQLYNTSEQSQSDSEALSNALAEQLDLSVEAYDSVDKLYDNLHETQNNNLQLSTDKADYMPGETAYFTA